MTAARTAGPAIATVVSPVLDKFAAALYVGTLSDWTCAQLDNLCTPTRLPVTLSGPRPIEAHLVLPRLIAIKDELARVREDGGDPHPQTCPQVTVTLEPVRTARADQSNAARCRETSRYS